MEKKKRLKKKTTPVFNKSGARGLPQWLDLCMPQLSVSGEPSWRYLPWLLVIAFILRAAAALSGDFVIHPDEIMQYLEPAHRLVFGSGVSYWEYYYGGRSWLVPSAVAAVLFLCKLLGLGAPLYYVAAVKLFFCALSLFIPLALYFLGRRFFSESTGRIALILGVFWYELVGFAHKPMTEFVATSLLLVLAMYALRPRLNARQVFIAGAMGLLVVAVRFHYTPLVGLILLVPFLRSDNNMRGLMAGGAAISVLAVGIFEYITWGGFLYSYWLNFEVNIVLNQHRGEESSAFIYIGWLSLASGGLFLAAAAAMLNYRRRLFLLLLAAAVLLPHITQAHREYRFIFVLIPLWLLLFADLLAIGWQQRKKAAGFFTARWRISTGVVYALFISAAGIWNAIPYQNSVYESYSRETGYVNFLHGQDEIFSIYRRLAADESVRGVQDITRPYFNSGGYYYLHKNIPFYTGSAVSYPPEAATEYVSHIIAFPLGTPGGVIQSGGRLVMTMKDDFSHVLPAYISDQSLNKLVFWTANGEARPIKGFSLSYTSDHFTIWKADNDRPVRRWKNYHIAPDSEQMYGIIEKAVGRYAKKPVENFGIEYSAELDDGADKSKPVE